MKEKLHIVSFSGGKDSTAMLLRLLEENRPVDIILFCDTGLEFPEMYDHIDKVEKYIGREITRIKSEKDFMYYATQHPRVLHANNVPGHEPGEVIHGYGYPTVFTRWCTRILKKDMISKFMTPLKKKYELVEYVGIAVDEPQRKRDKVYPLIEWNMTEKECLSYCYERGFDWGGLYEIWSRVSCWCCPLQSPTSLRKLKELRPELYAKLKEMDVEISKNPQGRFQHTRNLTDLERRFEVEDEFIAQGKKLRTKEFFNTLKERGINY